MTDVSKYIMAVNVAIDRLKIDEECGEPIVQLAATLTIASLRDTTAYLESLAKLPDAARKFAASFTAWIANETTIDFWSENNAEDRLAEMAESFIAGTQEPSDAEIAAVIELMDEEKHRVFYRRNKALDGPQFEVVFEPDPDAPINEDSQSVLGVFATQPEAAAVASLRNKIELARHYLMAAARARTA